MLYGNGSQESLFVTSGNSALSSLLETYAAIVGEDVVNQLRQLARLLENRRVVHVNSTREGGGVAEILAKLVPLMQELGLDTSWEVITGDKDFYRCTKSFHNALQGNRISIPDELLRAYEKTNKRTADELAPVLGEADIIFIHDPQPAPLLSYLPRGKSKWIWRCHIDLSHPYRTVWKYLRKFVTDYDVSIFSLSSFAQVLRHPQYLIPPSIDPLSDKNMALEEAEIQAAYHLFGIDPDRPVIAQVSRFDHFKDPIGVVRAFKLAKKYVPDLQLVLAGGGASDDPEGATVRREVEAFSEDFDDIHILELPSDAHRAINALQRVADVVLQKSVKEGFGLTVTEAMWKGKPVIGGNTGGIRLQVIDNHTGFLVNSPEGAALRIRYLLERPEKIREMGRKAVGFVRENFLLTRQLREYLTVMVALIHGCEDRIALG
jgi:trehalose synthase